jgi:hypothetical protein
MSQVKSLGGKNILCSLNFKAGRRTGLAFGLSYTLHQSNFHISMSCNLNTQKKRFLQ